MKPPSAAPPPFCPAYPRPRSRKAAALSLFFGARRSWLDVLYERSYHMMMGEVHLAGMDVYMVNEPAWVRHVLNRSESDFPKSPLLGEALRPLLGHSIFTTGGAQWARQRAMMDPAFAQGGLQQAFPAMRAAVEAMLQRLSDLPAQQPLDIEAEMTHVTADIIFRTIFSQPLEGAQARRLFEAFARFQALAPRLMLPAVFGVGWLKWPPDLWRSRAAAREIRAQLAALVRPRYEAYRAGQAPAQPRDILSAFLDARAPEDGAPFDFEELLDQVAMLFLAGHETSASALSWAVHLLSHSPQIQARMVQETNEVVGARRPEREDMRQLTLTWNVVRETLRLFPPVGFLPRRAAQACPMRDKQVPAGASVIVSPWLIQRHRAYWREPDAFDPDRYAQADAAAALKQAWLPFGMGPRVCLGATFALQESALVLSTLVRHFHVTPVPGRVPQPVGRLTIRSANGVWVQLRRREPAEVQP